jgi:hypothetical protein
MKVKELIRQLQGCCEDAEVLITIGNEDNDTLSTTDFEIHGQDKIEYIELFVNDENCSRQV